jgi:hypothetical protein
LQKIKKSIFSIKKINILLVFFSKICRIISYFFHFSIMLLLEELVYHFFLIRKTSKKIN